MPFQVYTGRKYRNHLKQFRQCELFALGGRSNTSNLSQSSNSSSTPYLAVGGGLSAHQEMEMAASIDSNCTMPDPNSTTEGDEEPPLPPDEDSFDNEGSPALLSDDTTSDNEQQK